LTFLRQVMEASTHRQSVVDQQGLPEGVRRLLALAAAVPEREGARRGGARLSWLASIGTEVLAGWKGAWDMVAFIGEAVLACLRLVGGAARFRRVDLVLFMQECGAQALGIVTLISFLIGLILAFMGAVQLRQFGAQIYVADLVGLGMTREMGAIMTGVIMAGRTGAAFAAQLGTMQVNEEIDALTTMGIPPMEFLVLPRMLALMVMMPLLCVYADLVGMGAGLLIGTGLLDMSLVQYVNETQKAVHLVDCGLGLFKSAVFGALVALAGCVRGMHCGRSAAAVGAAATAPGSSARGRAATTYTTSPSPPARIAPRENVKRTVAARPGTAVAPSTRTSAGSRSLLARWKQRITPTAASSPSAFQ
jgi:phospholipid/cholesterol/gamma-HCH transport system permease protein